MATKIFFSVKNLFFRCYSAPPSSAITKEALRADLLTSRRHSRCYPYTVASFQVRHLYKVTSLRGGFKDPNEVILTKIRPKYRTCISIGIASPCFCQSSRRGQKFRRVLDDGQRDADFLRIAEVLPRTLHRLRKRPCAKKGSQ
jgi:hypothetical protein